MKNIAATLFTACRREGRRAKRSRGESTRRHVLGVISAGSTHPAISASRRIGIPLSGRAGKREK